jgi:predicted GTPase
MFGTKFISSVADADIGVGHSLVSCTSEVNVVRVRVPDEDLEIVLVDTPGFDDTHKSDYEILKLIKDWLEQA